MAKLKLSELYRQQVRARDLNDADLLLVLRGLLDDPMLGFNIFIEETPDYRAVELQSKRP